MKVVRKSGKKTERVWNVVESIDVSDVKTKAELLALIEGLSDDARISLNCDYYGSGDIFIDRYAPRTREYTISESAEQWYERIERKLKREGSDEDIVAYFKTPKKEKRRFLRGWNEG